MDNINFLYKAENISKPQNSTDMFPTTDATRGLIAALERQEYGKTFAEMDAALTNTIVRLFSKLQMTIEQIAEITGIESNAILLVLKKHKLIKK